MSLPPEHVQAAAHEAQRVRGWIANGYAQVEYVLGDVLMQSRNLAEYDQVVGRLPHGAPARIAKVRTLLETDGFYSQFAERLLVLMAAFEEHHQVRNLLAHGYCTIYHTPDRDIGFEFRKWHRTGDNEDSEERRLFRLVDLEYHEAQLTPLAEEATTLRTEMHEALGIVE